VIPVSGLSVTPLNPNSGVVVFPIKMDPPRVFRAQSRPSLLRSKTFHHLWFALELAYEEPRISWLACAELPWAG
jgi:hypothetical protein